jgi:hypothetical protein
MAALRRLVFTLLLVFAALVAGGPRLALESAPLANAAPGDETFTTFAGATAHVWSGTPLTLGTSGGSLPVPISAVFEWSNANQSFRFWFRGFPANFNTLATLNADGFYFFQGPAGQLVTIEGSAGHQLAANQSSFNTVIGATGRLWTGGIVAPETLPAGVSAVFRWKDETQSFQFWFRGFPANFNTLPPALGRGKFYFLQAANVVSITSPTPPQDGSSSALIEQALAAGTLPILPGTTALESALAYKVFASFGDPRSAQFAVASPTFDEVAVREAALGYTTASFAAKALLDPFLLPPSAPGSWIENQPANATGLRASRSPVPMTPVFNQFSLFKVWYRNDRPQDAPTAVDVLAEMETVIDGALIGLMGSAHAPESDGNVPTGGDNRFDIYLVGPMPGTNIAHAQPYPTATCSNRPAYIVAEPMASLDLLKAQVASAYMEAILYTFLESCSPESLWLFFATATWAMDYVYPTLGFEHTYAQEFFDDLNRGSSLTGTTDEGAYTWLQFLARRPGGSASIVKQIWDGTALDDALTAMVQALGGQSAFNALWSEYARHTLNRDPDNFFANLDNLAASSAANVTFHCAGVCEESYLTKAGQVGLNTYRFTFAPGTTVNQVKIAWVPLTDDGQPTARARAFVKKGGNWTGPESWDFPANSLHNYCSQQVPGQQIQEVLLVFSNSDATTAKQAESVVAIQSLEITTGCPSTFHAELSGPPHGEVAAVQDATVVFEERPHPTPGVRKFVTVSGRLDWSATACSTTASGSFDVGPERTVLLGTATLVVDNNAGSYSVTSLDPSGSYGFGATCSGGPVTVRPGAGWGNTGVQPTSPNPTVLTGNQVFPGFQMNWEIRVP